MRREEKHVPPDVSTHTARYALKTRQESLGMRGLSPCFFEDAIVIDYTRAGACLDLEVVTNAIEEAFDYHSIKDLDVKDLLRQFEGTNLEFLNDRISTLIDHLIPSQFFDYGQNVYRNCLDAIARCQFADAPAEEDRELIDEVENVLVERCIVSRPARAAFENVLLTRRDEMQAMSYTEHEHLRAAINEGWATFVECEILREVLSPRQWAIASAEFGNRPFTYALGYALFRRLHAPGGWPRVFDVRRDYEDIRILDE